MTIRQATEADVPAMVEMGREFVRSTSYRDTVPESPEHLSGVGALLLKHGVVLLAEQDGRVVGMIAGTVYPHYLTGARTLGESWWWVNEGARGHGAADALLDALEAWGRSQGATRSELGSRNAVLDRFYRRRGYRPVERVHAKEL